MLHIIFGILVYLAMVGGPILFFWYLREKYIHPVPDASDPYCQKGFHTWEKQTAKDSRLVVRKQCKLCGYVPTNQ